MYNSAPCYFPKVRNPSIVTATRLNCCVRNGYRCFPRAMGTDATQPWQEAKGEVETVSIMDTNGTVLKIRNKR